MQLLPAGAAHIERFQVEWPELNEGYVFRDVYLKPSKRCEPISVKQFYERTYPAGVSEWQQRFENGSITVNGGVAGQDQMLKPRDVLLYHRPPWAEASAPSYIDILHEDDHLLVLAKPNGLQVLPSGVFCQRTVLELLRRRAAAQGKPTNAAPAHRLGRGTSGVLLCAYTEEARKLLAASMTHTTASAIQTIPVSKEAESVSKEAEPVSKKAEPVSKEAEPISRESEHVSKEAEPISKEAEPVSKKAEPISKESGTEPCGHSHAEASRSGPVLAEASRDCQDQAEACSGGHTHVKVTQTEERHRTPNQASTKSSDQALVEASRGHQDQSGPSGSGQAQAEETKTADRQISHNHASPKPSQTADRRISQDHTSPKPSQTADRQISHKHASPKPSQTADRQISHNHASPKPSQPEPGGVPGGDQVHVPGSGIPGGDQVYRKIYRALVQGLVQQEGGCVDAPIGLVTFANAAEGLFAACPDGGKAAHSVWRMLHRDVHSCTSLLEVEIFTGRPHQIRIHTACIGHPLAGDPLYAPGGLPRPSAVEEGKRPGDCGYLLHAHTLLIAHPVTGKGMCFVAPTPLELRTPDEQEA